MPVIVNVDALATYRVATYSELQFLHVSGCSHTLRLLRPNLT